MKRHVAKSVGVVISAAVLLSNSSSFGGGFGILGGGGLNVLRGLGNSGVRRQSNNNYSNNNYSNNGYNNGYSNGRYQQNYQNSYQPVPAQSPTPAAAPAATTAKTAPTASKPWRSPALQTGVAPSTPPGVIPPYNPGGPIATAASAPPKPAAVAPLADKPAKSRLVEKAVARPELPDMPDLKIVDVRLIDAGDAKNGEGPSYRVTFCNSSKLDVKNEFDVALFASTSKETTADVPHASVRVEGILANQSLTVDLRLPDKANNLGTTAAGEPISFSWLTARVDVRGETQEANRDNNTSTLGRDQVQMLAEN